MSQKPTDVTADLLKNAKSGLKKTNVAQSSLLSSPNTSAPASVPASAASSSAVSSSSSSSAPSSATSSSTSSSAVATPNTQIPAAPVAPVTSSPQLQAGPLDQTASIRAALQSLTLEQRAFVLQQAQLRQANQGSTVNNSHTTSSSSGGALPSRSSAADSALFTADYAGMEVKTRSDRPQVAPPVAPPVATQSRVSSSSSSSSSSSATTPAPSMPNNRPAQLSRPPMLAPPVVRPAAVAGLEGGLQDRKNEGEEAEQKIAAISADMKKAMEEISKLSINVQTTMGVVASKEPYDEALVGQYSALLAEIEPHYQALQKHADLFEDQRPSNALPANRALVNSGFAGQFHLDPREMRQRLLAALDIDVVIAEIKQTIATIKSKMPIWNKRYADIMMGKTALPAATPVVVPAVSAVQPAQADNDDAGIVIEGLVGGARRVARSTATVAPQAPVAPTGLSIPAPARQAPRPSVGGATSSATTSSAIGTIASGGTTPPGGANVNAAPGTRAPAAKAAPKAPSSVSSVIGSSPSAQPTSQTQLSQSQQQSQQAEALVFLGLLFAKASQGDEQARQAIAKLQANAPQSQSGSAPAMLSGFAVATAQSQQQIADLKLLADAKRLVGRFEALKPRIAAYKAYAGLDNAEVAQVSGVEPHAAGVRVDPNAVEGNRVALQEVQAHLATVEQAISSLKAYTDKPEGALSGDRAALSSLVTDLSGRCDRAVKTMNTLEQVMESQALANSTLYL